MKVVILVDGQGRLAGAALAHGETLSLLAVVGAQATDLGLTLYVTEAQSLHSLSLDLADRINAILEEGIKK